MICALFAGFVVGSLGPHGQEILPRMHLLVNNRPIPLLSVNCRLPEHGELLLVQIKREPPYEGHELPLAVECAIRKNLQQSKL
jgi:hypothetical protein